MACLKIIIEASVYDIKEKNQYRIDWHVDMDGVELATYKLLWLEH